MSFLITWVPPSSQQMGSGIGFVVVPLTTISHVFLRFKVFRFSIDQIWIFCTSPKDKSGEFRSYRDTKRHVVSIVHEKEGSCLGVQPWCHLPWQKTRQDLKRCFVELLYWCPQTLLKISSFPCLHPHRFLVWPRSSFRADFFPYFKKTKRNTYQKYRLLHRLQNPKDVSVCPGG